MGLWWRVGTSLLLIESAHLGEGGKYLGTL